MSIDTNIAEHLDHGFDAHAEARVLAARLERGWNIIEQKIGAGEDVEALERHWLGLLNEYESLCDRLPDARD